MCGWCSCFLATPPRNVSLWMAGAIWYIFIDTLVTLFVHLLTSCDFLFVQLVLYFSLWCFYICLVLFIDSYQLYVQVLLFVLVSSTFSFLVALVSIFFLCINQDILLVFHKSATFISIKLYWYLYSTIDVLWIHT